MEKFSTIHGMEIMTDIVLIMAMAKLIIITIGEFGRVVRLKIAMEAIRIKMYGDMKPVAQTKNKF